MSFRYDVFISYSHVDSDWVKTRLLPELEGHGFTVCIDFRDFVTGATSVTEMERAVQESRHILAVLSDSYVKSEWSTVEAIMAQTLDPAAVQRRLIPVLLSNCTLPLRLQILNYRNLSKDDPVQWDLLMRDLA